VDPPEAARFINAAKTAIVKDNSRVYLSIDDARQRVETVLREFHLPDKDERVAILSLAITCVPVDFVNSELVRGINMLFGVMINLDPPQKVEAEIMSLDNKFPCYVGSNGGLRSKETEKVDYTYAHPEMLRRLCLHMQKGATHYGRDNWKQLTSKDDVVRYKRSLLRHCMQYLHDLEPTDEDHLAAIIFNVQGLMYLESIKREELV